VLTRHSFDRRIELIVFDHLVLRDGFSKLKCVS